MHRKFVSALSMIAMAGALAQPAIAQENKIVAPSCDCQIDGGTVNGKITKASGDVFISTASGYVNGTVGDTFKIGSEVATGAQSSAQLALGQNCRINLSANAIVTTTTQLGNQMCVKVASSTVETGVSTQANGNDALTFAVGTGIFGAIWWANRDGDDDPVGASR